MEDKSSNSVSTTAKNENKDSNDDVPEMKDTSGTSGSHIYLSVCLYVCTSVSVLFNLGGLVWEVCKKTMHSGLRADIFVFFK